MDTLKFTKMHGIGNDYVYVNCFHEVVEDPVGLSKKISDRHFGVGSDGLILILPSEIADCKMRIFNADGSEAQMCGNGIRCVAKYVYDHALVRKNPLTVETLAGIKTIELYTKNERVCSARVNMGRPKLMRPEIPMVGAETQVVDEMLVLNENTSFRVTCVSMGNPHCVIFVDDLKQLHIEKDGKAIGATGNCQLIDGRQFQRWSRHRTPGNPWRSGVDDIEAHIILVKHWLEREFAK